jgi:Co/Zn/Cd efflux system component
MMPVFRVNCDLSFGAKRYLIIAHLIVNTVWGMATKWPDLLVAAIMATLFLTSSIQILRQSFKEMRMARLMPAK